MFSIFLNISHWISKKWNPWIPTWLGRSGQYQYHCLRVLIVFNQGLFSDIYITQQIAKKIFACLFAVKNMFELGWAKCQENLGIEGGHSPARGKASELTQGEKFPLQLKKAAFAGSGLTFYAPIYCSNERLYEWWLIINCWDQPKK